MREKEMAIWNANDLSKPLEHKRLDSSSGVMLPLYDEDTSMMFYLSRGESTLRWLEIGESSPFMTEGTPIAIPGPVTGVGLVPKRILNVIQTEVVRILAVNPNGLWPVSFSVPRRVSTYRSLTPSHRNIDSTEHSHQGFHGCLVDLS
jgi:coronin-7